MVSALEYIRQAGTRISCDTMEVSVAKNFQGKKYINATSNQIISYNGLQLDENKTKLAEAAQEVAKDDSIPKEKKIDFTVYRAMAKLGKPMSDELDGGCVLTQTAPSNGFNTKATVQNARDLIKAFEAEGLSKDQVIIKVPATWEGLQACKQLQSEGINTLGTMVFTVIQAIVAAQCNCNSISPYVDGIDLNLNPDLWYEKYGKISNMLEQPGVAVVKEIHEYYRSHDVKTQLIPAGMIDCKEPVALAGVDEYTLPPGLLLKLATMTEFEGKSVLDPVERGSKQKDPEVSESDFRWAFSQDTKATTDISNALNAFYEFEIKLQKEAEEALSK